MNGILRTILCEHPQKLTKEEVIDLPALIPNQPTTAFFKDQWERRSEMKHPTSKSARFVFTFMERPIKKDFIEISVHQKLKEFYSNIRKKHPFKRDKKAPFAESWFWNEISKVDFPKFLLHQKLRLYITAWAGEEQFPLFFNTEKRSFNSKIYTRIRNKSIKIHRLPAFKHLV
jgi:hypothetical protein